MSNEHTILAERMKAVQPFHVMALLAEAKRLEASGRDVIHLEVGEPDFATPQPIVEAGMQALQQGRTKYTAATGLPELRERISDYYQQRFGVTVNPRRIIITPGASGALQLALGVLLNPGDEVLMSDPGYPCNRNFVRLFEGVAREISVDATTRYQLTPEHINAHWQARSKVAMVASPANPTGTVLSQQDIAALSQAVRQKKGVLLVDEIYQGLTYGVPDETALSVADDLWVVNSFSKYFGMTGWRLGWLVAPDNDEILSALDRLAQNIFLSAPTPAQYAALAAFSDESLGIMEERRQQFQQRRDFLLPALRDLGFQIESEPEGAFYIYANSQAFSEDSHALCLTMLEKTGVAFTPGIDFGQHQANTHVRFAYTRDVAQLAQAVERLARHLPA